MSVKGSSISIAKRTDNYAFTSNDPNDPRLVELKATLKGTGLRVKRVGRTPKPGEKWRSGYLPLFAAERYDTYIYPIDNEYFAEMWNGSLSMDDYIQKSNKLHQNIANYAKPYRA